MSGANTYEIKPPTGPLNAVVHLPGATDLARRAMVAAALADGTSRLSNVHLTEDTRDLIDALRCLGVQIRLDEPLRTLDITGTRGYWPNSEAELLLRDEAGMHVLAAACCLGHGQYCIDVPEQLRERPVSPLTDALINLGASIGYAGQTGYPPITIRASGLRGGTTCVAPSPSPAGAVLLAAPYARTDVFIELAGNVARPSDLAATLAIMEAFGAAVVPDETPRLIVPAPQRYRAATYTVEPDALLACCFLAAPAVAGGTVSVDGLGTSTVQSDIGLIDVLDQMGCHAEKWPNRLTVAGPSEGHRLHGIDVDLGTMPDTVFILAVVALFADGPTRIRNLVMLRNQGTDRLANLSQELTRLGAKVEIRDDAFTIIPPARVEPATIDAHDDARLAMSFTLAGLAAAGIVIRDPRCISATFPPFFDHFEQMCS